MSKTGLTFEAVRQIALSLADVEEAISYGAPALKIHGNLLACVPVVNFVSFAQ